MITTIKLKVSSAIKIKLKGKGTVLLETTISVKSGESVKIRAVPAGLEDDGFLLENVGVRVVVVPHTDFIKQIDTPDAIIIDDFELDVDNSGFIIRLTKEHTSLLLPSVKWYVIAFQFYDNEENFFRENDVSLMVEKSVLANIGDPVY